MNNPIYKYKVRWRKMDNSNKDTIYHTDLQYIFNKLSDFEIEKLKGSTILVTGNIETAAFASSTSRREPSFNSRMHRLETTPCRGGGLNEHSKFFDSVGLRPDMSGGGRNSMNYLRNYVPELRLSNHF